MNHASDRLILRGNEIRNRIAMAPMVTFTLHGDDGAYYGSQQVQHYIRRAQGGAGLIIVQGTNVFGASSGTGMWTAKDMRALKEMAAGAHEFGSKIMLQLSCGDVDVNLLSAQDIAHMQDEMKQAAIAACAIGFDGVEYHGAHGYTLCKFLDSDYNARKDDFGGSVACRARVITGILPELRARVHDRFLVSVRMGAFTATLEEGISTARHFEKYGIDLLHVSYGRKKPELSVPADFPLSPVTYSASLIKQAVRIPVIAVNEIRTAQQVDFLIENGCADIAGIGRGMLADPDFANRVLTHEPLAQCRGCSRCFWFTDHTKCPADINKAN